MEHDLIFQHGPQSGVVDGQLLTAKEQAQTPATPGGPGSRSFARSVEGKGGAARTIGALKEATGGALLLAKGFLGTRLV